MPVQPLEQEMQRLQSAVLALGRMVKAAIVESVQVLQRRAPTTSHSLITLDHQITKKRFAIELDCITLIATRQTINADLRTVTSMLEIATELEHMGDYITDIANIHFMVVKVEGSLLDLLIEIQHIAEKAQDMLQQALEAFERQDVALARAVHSQDNEVDALYHQVYQEILLFMQGKSRTTIKQARYLAHIVRNLERIADRTTNICEWVVFAVTGDITQTADQSIDLYQEILT